MKKTKILKIKLCLILFLLSLPLSLSPAAEEANTANNLISFDLKDADLKDALKIISQASGMNIILDKDVKATVSATLKDVTWQAALDNMLKTNELTYRIEGNVIRVMTITTTKKEEEIIPLKTKIISLNFAKAADLQASLNKILTGRGNIQTNTTTNSLIMTDTPETLARIEELAQQLDVRTPQVLIEAMIMSVKLTGTDSYGVDWTMWHKKRPERTITQSAIGTMTSILGATYGKTIFPNWNFSADLAFFSEDLNVKILASPRVLTLDNLAAQIQINEQVAYTYVAQSTEGGSITSTTQFRDTGIQLNVTPHITKDRFISLAIRAEQSYVAAYVEGQPSIDSRRVETNFMLKDGEVAVIGGLRKRDHTTTIDKVPILGDMPFVGKFFRSEVKQEVETELLIFISPSIVEDRLLTVRDEEEMNKGMKELTGKRLSLKEKLELRNRAIQEAFTAVTRPSPAVPKGEQK